MRATAGGPSPESSRPQVWHYVGTLLLALACSLFVTLDALASPGKDGALRTVLPAAMSQWDSVLAPVVGTLSEEEVSLLYDYLQRKRSHPRYASSRAVEQPFTVAQALDEQRSIRAQESQQWAEFRSRLAKMLESSSEQERRARSVARAAVLESRTVAPDTQDTWRQPFLQVWVSLLNVGEVPLSSATGTIEARDPDGNRLALWRVNLSPAAALKPAEGAVVLLRLPYDLSRREEMRLLALTSSERTLNVTLEAATTSPAF